MYNSSHQTKLRDVCKLCAYVHKYMCRYLLKSYGSRADSMRRPACVGLISKLRARVSILHTHILFVHVSADAEEPYRETCGV